MPSPPPAASAKVSPRSLLSLLTSRLWPLFAIRNTEGHRLAKRLARNGDIRSLADSIVGQFREMEGRLSGENSRLRGDIYKKDKRIEELEAEVIRLKSAQIMVFALKKDEGNKP